MEDLSDYENSDQEKGISDYFSRLNSVDKLGTALQGTLQLKDTTPTSDSDSSFDDTDINFYGSPRRCLQTDDTTDLYLRAMSLPPPDKLVSSMRGAREKEGGPLRVTWAPDVRDPLPSNLTPLPKQRKQTEYTKANKKYGKGKQKGKMAKGGGSNNDKKQYQKMSTKSQRGSVKGRGDYGDDYGYDDYGYGDY